MITVTRKDIQNIYKKTLHLNSIEVLNRKIEN